MTYRIAVNQYSETHLYSACRIFQKISNVDDVYLLTTETGMKTLPLLLSIYSILACSKCIIREGFTGT